MTTDEKRKHRAELQIEIEDTESDFAYCRDRARGLASGLQDVAAVILRNADLEARTDNYDFTADAELENRLNPTQLARLQDWKSVIEILGELRRYRQDLHNLRKRMTDLQRVATI